MSALPENIVRDLQSRILLILPNLQRNIRQSNTGSFSEKSDVGRRYSLKLAAVCLETVCFEVQVINIVALYSNSSKLACNHDIYRLGNSRLEMMFSGAYPRGGHLGHVPPP